MKWQDFDKSSICSGMTLALSFKIRKLLKQLANHHPPLENSSYLKVQSPILSITHVSYCYLLLPIVGEISHYLPIESLALMVTVTPSNACPCDFINDISCVVCHLFHASLVALVTPLRSTGGCAFSKSPASRTLGPAGPWWRPSG